MKATKTALIATLAMGSLLMFSPALRADGGTTAPPSMPQMGDPPPGGMRGPGMRGPNFDRLAHRLNLTDKQKPKVQAIFEKQQRQMRRLRQNQSLSREERMAKMRTIHEQTVAKLKAVLTAGQFKKLREMRPMMGGPAARGRMFFDRLAKRLNLTAEQKPEVQAIFGKQFRQMRALRQDQSLSREERMAKMRTIHQATITKLKGVLTVDQFQKFREMRPMMGGPRHGPGPWGPPPGGPPPQK